MKLYVIDNIHKPHKNSRLIACCGYSLCLFLDNNDHQMGVLAQGFSFCGLIRRLLSLSNKVVPRVMAESSFPLVPSGSNVEGVEEGTARAAKDYSNGSGTPLPACVYGLPRLWQVFVTWNSKLLFRNFGPIWLKMKIYRVFGNSLNRKMSKIHYSPQRGNHWGHFTSREKGPLVVLKPARVHCPCALDTSLCPNNHRDIN